MAPTTGLRGRVPPLAIGALCIGIVIVAVALATSPSSPTGAPSSSANTSTTISTTSTVAPRPTSTTVAEPDDLGSFVVAPVERTSCGSDLPVVVDVPDSPAAIEGPAPSTPDVDGQVVRHWATPNWTVEARWPPDRRQLQFDQPGANIPVVLESWGVNRPGSVSAWGHDSGTGASVPVIFTIDDPSEFDYSALPSACRVLQVRIITTDGTTQTVGVPLPVRPDRASLVDLDPLVNLSRTSPADVPRNRSTECPDHVDREAVVRFEQPSASPREALRDFLESEAADPVVRPEVPRPFEETFMEHDGTYRYEHFLAWSEYIAITVDRFGDGWAVTNWEHGEC